MFLPSPSTWKMVKDAPNHVLMKIIGLAHSSLEISEDGDVPILPVFLSTPDSLHVCYRTGIPLSTFCAEVNTICIWPYIQCQCATGPWNMDGVLMVEFENWCHKFGQSLKYAPLGCHDDKHETLDQILCECLNHSFSPFPSVLIPLACLQIHRAIPCPFLFFGPIVTMMK